MQHGSSCLGAARNKHRENYTQYVFNDSDNNNNNNSNNNNSNHNDDNS